VSLPVTTERLVLRRFTDADVADLLECVSDPAFARATPEIEATETSVRAYISAQNQLEPFEQDKCFDLAVQRKREGKVLGLLSLVRKAQGQGEIGYALGRAHRGQGYATEAARGLLGYAFTTLGLHRVQATTRPANRGSWRVMERLGMRREGHLREAAYQEGKWSDVLIYGILASEFRWTDA
jgi:RimJ/RimL family protein N-acetyltransferase